MNTAVIYARVSSTGDRQSTGRQIADLTKYARYRELDVVGVFEEHVSGAAKNGERPALRQALECCREGKVGFLLVSELSRLGRNAFEVLSTVKVLIDSGVNLYIQKERFTLLDDDGKPSLFAPVMLATLATCAQLERENIAFRLQSGYRQHVEKGGKVGRKPGSTKSRERLQEEYAEVIRLLKKGYTIRDTAKLAGKGVSTVQRVKKMFLQDIGKHE